MEDSSAEVSFRPLNNGLDYLSSVVEHLVGNPSDRDLKYAVLHLAAAIEVLLKARLAREHWSLIFTDLDKASPERLRTGDFQSVGAKIAIARLRSIVGVDVSKEMETAVINVVGKRNRLQHFGLTDTVESVRSVAVTALSHLLTFLDRELRSQTGSVADPVDDVLVEIRDELADITTFVETRLAGLGAELDSCEAIVDCPRCTQRALEPGESCRCHFCLTVGEPDETASDYTSAVLGISRYEVIKDGAEWPVHSCPSCGLKTLVGGVEFRDETGDGRTQSPYWVCFAEGITWAYAELDQCDRCGSLTTVHDDGFAICSVCSDAFRLVD